VPVTRTCHGNPTSSRLEPCQSGSLPGLSRNGALAFYNGLKVGLAAAKTAAMLINVMEDMC